MANAQLRLHDAAGAFVCLLPDFLEGSMSEELNDTGAVSFSYPRNGRNADQLAATLDGQVSVWLDGVELPVRLVLEDDGDDDADTEQPLQVSGRGTLALLERALVYPSGGAGTVPATHSFAAGSTPGTILGTLLTRAQARGGLAGVTWTFTSTHDSAGVAWANTMAVDYDAGVTLLQVAQGLAGQGVVDVRMVGTELQAYNPDSATGLGRDRPGVVLQLGRHVRTLPRQRSRREIASHVLVVGDGGANAERANATTAATYGRREAPLSQGNTTDAGTMATLGDAELTSRSKPQHGRTADYDLAAPGAPAPWADYQVGDYIRADKVRLDSATLEPLRVRTMAVAFDADGLVAPSLELSDVFLEATVRLQRRMDGIVNGTVQPVPVAGDGPADTVAPGASAGVVISSAAYQLADGSTHAQATISWATITTNADATVCDDLDHYLVAWRDLNAPGTGYGPATVVPAGTTSVDASPFPIGHHLQAYVVGVDRAGNRGAAAYSASTLLASDATAPPTPSTPVLTPALGVVRVAWDGLGSAGEAMPADLAHVEVHAGAASGFTPTAATLRDQLQAAGIAPLVGDPYGAQLYVVLVAVDRSGNRSAKSAEASAAPQQVDLGDLPDNLITGAKLVADAVGTLQLAADAVTEAKLATDAVSARVLAPAAVDTAAIQASAVTATELAAAAVTAGKIAANAVTTDTIAADAVVEAKLATDAVSTRVLAAGAVTSAELANLAVTTAALDAAAVTTAKIAANAVAEGNLATDAVSTRVLAPDAVTATELAALAVTNAKLADDAVDTRAIATGAVTAGELAAAAVTADKLGVTIGGGNLLRNSGFESASLDYWSLSQGGAGGALALSTAHPRAGSTQGAVLTQGSGYTYANQTVPVFGQRPVVVSVWVWSAAASAIRLVLRPNAGTGYLPSPVKALAAGWTRVAHTITPNDDGANSAGVSIGWEAADAAPGTVVYLDDAQVELGDVLTAYAPRPDEVLPGTITATEIADNAVTTPKLVAGAVVAGKIAADAVSANELAANAVTAAKIDANAVTAGKIAAGAVTAGTIAAGAVVAGDIAALSITANELAAGAVTTAKLVAGAVTANELAANAVTAGKIAAGTVTANELAAGAVTTAKLVAGAVTANELAAGAVTAGKIDANAVTANELAAGAVTAGKIAAGAVVAGDIAAGTVTTTELAAGSVTAAKIAAGSVTAEKLTVGSLGDNLLPNPSFEDLSAGGTFPAGWITAGDRLAAAARSGAYGLRIVPQGGPAQTAFEYPVAPGDVFAFSAWARKASGVTCFYMRMTFHNAAGAYLANVDVVGNADVPTGWTQYSAQITAPAGAVSYIIELYNYQPGGATGDLYVDDVDLRRVTVAVQIANGAVVADKIAAGAVTAGKIAADAVTAAEIAAGSITTAELAAGAVVTGKVAAGAITANEIAANTITAAQIAAGTITANELAANTITAAKIAAGTITSTEIAAGTIVAADIAAGTITATQIATGTITANELAANAVTANKVLAGAIDVTKLAAGTLSAGNITTGTLAADVVLGARLKTANSGARVELSSVGLEAYNAGGTRTVFVDAATGNATFVGVVKTGTTGARIELVSGDPTYGSRQILLYGALASMTTPARVLSEDSVLDSAGFDAGWLRLMSGKRSDVPGTWSEAYITVAARGGIDIRGAYDSSSGAYQSNVAIVGKSITLDSDASNTIGDYGSGTPRLWTMYDVLGFASSSGGSYGRLRGANYSNTLQEISQFERRSVSVTRSANKQADVSVSYVGVFSARPLVVGSSDQASSVSNDAVIFYGGTASAVTMRVIDVESTARSVTMTATMLAML